MGFRISPYKIIRLVAIIAVLSYGFVEISEFRKKKTKETEKVEKTLDIRKKDFYNSQEEKQKILNQGNETTIASNGDGKSETGQPTVTVKISEANKESQKTDEVQQEKADKEKAAVLKKAQEQKKAEEEAQRKIVDQIAQQKKAAAEKKAREAEAIAAAKKAKELGKTVILNPAPARQLSDELLSNIDYLTPNETELMKITSLSCNDDKEIEKACKYLLEKGVKNVIVTLGENGSMLVNKDLVEKISAFKVKSVDTTAAGDCFNGAFVTALSKGDSLKEAITFASKAAAISVTRKGAISSLPSLKEILDLE